MIWLYKVVGSFFKTPMGRAVAGASAILAAVLAIMAYGENKGKQEMRERELKRELRAARKKTETTNEVQSLDDDALVFRSSRWVR